MDRRSISRCPVCSGPTVAAEQYPEGVRCRNSMCSHNFANVPCPRCQELNPDVVSCEKGITVLECKECLNRFKHPVASA